MVIEPNIKKDKLILKKEVSILVEGLPSFSFKNGKLYNDSFLHYDAELYETEKKEKYYIFKSFDDCTLYIMNCNEEIYKVLSKQIEIDDSIDIFDVSSDFKNKKETYHFIPTSYRKEEGFGGMATIMFG